MYSLASEMAERTAFTAWKYNLEFVGERGKNITMKCILCLGVWQLQGALLLI